MAACDRALQLPELLERILLHLPLRDLLLSERVSKEWQANLKASIHIRRALFLEPSSQSRVLYKNTRNDSPWRWGSIEGSRVNQDPIINPLVESFMARGCCKGYFTLQHTGFISPSNPVHQGDRLPPQLIALHRAGSSWRNMLVMQPAAVSLTVICNEESHQKVVVEDEAGTRFGELVRGTREHWMVCPDCPINKERDTSWMFAGKVQRMEQEVTGWQMLQELEQFAAPQ